MLLAAACPETSTEDLKKLSIGRRDARLLQLREWTFGPQMVAWTACPRCGDKIELRFRAEDLLQEPGGFASKSREETDPEIFQCAIDDYVIDYRLPNSEDLAALLTPGDLWAASSQLIQRCVLAVHRHGDPTNAALLPVEIQGEFEKRLSQADPQAEILLSISCPVCSQTWQALFDIASFFWEELDNWAGRMLREVHELASAYGWREEEILALSPRRRQFYLDLIRRGKT